MPSAGRVVNKVADLDDWVQSAIADGQVPQFHTGSGTYTGLTVAAPPVSSVFGRVGAVAAAAGDYRADQVTNAVDQAASYANPSWVTSLAGSKVTGDIAGNAASITGSIAESQVTGLTGDLAALSAALGAVNSLTIGGAIAGAPVAGDVLYVGAGGVLAQAAITGLLKWSSGGPAAAVAGTDYVAPNVATAGAVIATQGQFLASSVSTKAVVARRFSGAQAANLIECQNELGNPIGFRALPNGTPSCPSPNANIESERFGEGTLGNANYSTSIGRNANAGGTASTAVGRAATVTHGGSTALGERATSSAVNQLMIGSSGTPINMITFGGAAPIADSAAPNNSLFVGSDHANSLCWKDGAGAVSALY